MDGDGSTQPGIQLERSLPVFLRLSVAAAALFFLGWQIGEFFVPTDGQPAGNGGSVAVVLLCVVLILASAFLSDVRWTIRPNEIEIERKRGIGRRCLEIVDRADISDVTIYKEGTEHGLRVWLLLDRTSKPSIESPAARFGTDPDRLKAEIATRLLIVPSIKRSGDVLISPPLRDITRVNETTATVSGLLGLPDAAPVDNPLDADTAEITLGSPVSPDFGRVIRMTVPVLAGLSTLPFLIAFWIGESNLALGIILPVGLLAAFALYRYAHRLAGAFWIIRRGEIRIEQIALNGEPSVETIRAGDIAWIEVGKPNAEDGTCRITIRLHTGQTFRSPTSHDEDGARALRGEIIRRLRLDPSVAG